MYDVDCLFNAELPQAVVLSQPQAVAWGCRYLQLLRQREQQHRPAPAPDVAYIIDIIR